MSLIKGKVFKLFVVLLLLQGCSNDDSILEAELGSLKNFQSKGKYSIIMIPDTQRYFRAEKGPDIFRKKIEWISSYADKLDVKFITHIGDVIEDGKGNVNHQEWLTSVDILKKLDELSKSNEIPYSISLGDHDYNGNEKPRQGYTAFVKHFGKKRYETYPWYGGSSNTETSHYQYFKANGRKILHINIECDAPRRNDFATEEDQIKWAQKIIDQNKGLPVIVSTHAYLTDEFKNGKFVGHEPKPEVKKKNRRKGEGRRGGVDIWKDLISKNDQIFMVLCGNYHEYNDRKGETGELYQVVKNSKGRDVIEILANYQDYPNGGDGLFRILVFDEEKGKLIVKTYSSYNKKFRKKYLDTSRASDFEIPIDLNKRLSF